MGIASKVCRNEICFHLTRKPSRTPREVYQMVLFKRKQTILDFHNFSKTQETELDSYIGVNVSSCNPLPSWEFVTRHLPIVPGNVSKLL